MSAPENSRSDAAGTRWRLVTVRDGERHVSSVVLSEEEATHALEVEAELHRTAGWEVDFSGGVILATLGDITRMISAEAFDPLDDSTF